MLRLNSNSMPNFSWKAIRILILLSLLAYAAYAPISFWDRIANCITGIGYSRIVRIPFAFKEWCSDDHRRLNRSNSLGQRHWLVDPKDFNELPLTKSLTKIGHIAWVLDLGLHKKHNLIAADSEKLYFMTDGEVLAVDEFDGAQRWSISPYYAFRSCPAVNQSAFADGRLVVSFDNRYTNLWRNFNTLTGKMTEHREVYSVENGRDLLLYPFHGRIICKQIWNHLYEEKESKWFPSDTGHRVLRVGNRSLDEYRRVTIDERLIYIRNNEGDKEHFSHSETHLGKNSILIPARYPDGCRDVFKENQSQANRFVSPHKETFNDNYLLHLEYKEPWDKNSSLTVLSKIPWSGHYKCEAYESGNIDGVDGHFHLKSQGLIAYGWFNASQGQAAKLAFQKIEGHRLHKFHSIQTKYRTQWLFTDDRLYFLYLGLLYAVSI